MRAVFPPSSGNLAPGRWKGDSEKVVPAPQDAGGGGRVSPQHCAGKFCVPGKKGKGRKSRKPRSMKVHSFFWEGEKGGEKKADQFGRVMRGFSGMFGGGRGGRGRGEGGGPDMARAPKVD